MRTKGRKKRCAHCGHTPANRPRQLCWNCYYTPGVRDGYSVSDSKYANRGVKDIYGGNRLDSIPTRALPGTLDKVAVLERRARMHVALWHPHDAPWEHMAQEQDAGAA